MPEIVVETPQRLEVDGVLINPDDLHHFRLAGGTLPGKERLVDKREPVIGAFRPMGGAPFERKSLTRYPARH
ncbi:hypothetical protein [Mycobacterium sp. 050134]|uniref:hypothetical protein n=1 Tax=Mycobacterium sp. 050134 TaxID=3096111 RepID=UPI002EDAF35C